MHQSMNDARLSTTEPFVATYPILALYCAVNFNLPAIGQVALHVFACCHESRVLPTMQFLDILSYLEGIKHRELQRGKPPTFYF